jgi:hypothetical protein
MSNEIYATSLKDTVSQFLTPTKISEIATRIGYDSKANFTPGEYASLLDRTIKVILKQLKNDLHYPNQGDEHLKMVTSIVDETLSKECNKVPYDEAFPDIPAFFHNLITSILFYLPSRSSS